MRDVFEKTMGISFPIFGDFESALNKLHAEIMDNGTEDVVDELYNSKKRSKSKVELPVTSYGLRILACTLLLLSWDAERVDSLSFV
jgi:hypothetical protein